MKKVLSVILAVFLIAAVTACSQEKGPNTIKDGKKLQDVIAAVDERFSEQYGDGYRAVMMPMEVDELYLTDFVSIDITLLDEFAGAVSMSMTNSDAFFGLKIKEGNMESIKAAIEKYREDLIAQYERYPVNGSFERAKTSVIYQKGDYLFFIGVGIMPSNPQVESLDFSGDVAMVKTAIDSMFNV